MVQLDFDGVLASLGDSASADAVVNALRGIEPVAAIRSKKNSDEIYIPPLSVLIARKWGNK